MFRKMRNAYQTLNLYMLVQNNDIKKNICQNKKYKGENTLDHPDTEPQSMKKPHENYKILGIMYLILTWVVAGFILGHHSLSAMYVNLFLWYSMWHPLIQIISKESLCKLLKLLAHIPFLA